MIFAKAGTVHIEGSTSEIEIDLISVIMGVKAGFEKNMSEEMTREIIAEAARKAFDPPKGISQTLVEL